MLEATRALGCISSLQETRRAIAVSNRKMPRPLPRPTLGARVLATPTLGDVEAVPVWGTITFIHETHFWYEVTFDRGYRNCFQWGCTK